MKRIGTLAVAMAALLGANSSASQQLGDHSDGFFHGKRPDQILLSNLMTAPVVDPDNRQIGNVDDLLMDHEGRVIGLVMDIGGFLGLGSRSIAIGIGHLEFGLVGEAPEAVAGQRVGEPQPQWGPPSTPLVVPGATPDPAPRHAVGWRGITGGQIEYVRVPLDREQLEAAPEFARVD